MIPRNATDPDAKRTKLCGTSAAPDLHSDPDKAAVMRWISGIVADRLAEWEMLDGGDVQLRFNSGATLSVGEVPYRPARIAMPDNARFKSKDRSLAEEVSG